MGHDTAKKLFLEAYDEHADAIYRYCAIKVSDAERAQDLTQEVFVRYWQTLQKGERIQNDRAYLYTLARNLVTDWYRRKKETSLDALTETGLDFAGSSDKEITQTAEISEALAVVREMDDESQEILLLRYVEGRTPQEIAKILKVTPNVVSVRIHRAVKKLQDRLHTHE